MIIKVYGKQYKIDWYHVRHAKPIPVKIIRFHAHHKASAIDTFKTATTGCDFQHWIGRCKTWNSMVIAETMCLGTDNFSRRQGRKKSFTKAVGAVCGAVGAANHRLWRTRVWAEYKKQMPNDFK